MCVGCGRLLVEITGWLNCGDEDKKQIVQAAQQRLKMLQTNIYLICLGSMFISVY